MDVRQLRYFVSIVDLGSFSRAAEHLGVAQPSLSQQVRLLEDELDVQLLHRTPRGAVPTEAGSRLAERARSIISQMADIPSIVLAGAEDLSGEVRFGMPATVTAILSVPLIELAQTRHPNIRVRVVEAMSNHIIDWIRKGDVDIGISADPPDTKGIRLDRILKEPLHVFCGSGADPRYSGAAMTLEEALSLPLILPAAPNGLRVILDRIAAANGIHLDPLIEINSHNQIKNLVGRGHGFSILPATSIRNGVQSGTFRSWSITTPSLYRPLYITHSTDIPISRASLVIAELAWECVRGLVHQGAWQADWEGGSRWNTARHS